MFDLFSLIAGIIIGVASVLEYRALRHLYYSGRYFFRMFTSAIGSICLVIAIIFVLYKLFESSSKKR